MTNDELLWLRDRNWPVLSCGHGVMSPQWIAPYLSLVLDRILTHEEAMRLVHFINERIASESPEAAVALIRDAVRSDEPAFRRRTGSC